VAVKKIMITNVLNTKSAFGVFQNDYSQNVFIPSKVFADNNLKVGAIVDALIVPNTKHQSKTPWLAAKIEERNFEPIDLNKERNKKLILEILNEFDSTIYEIENSLNIGEESIQLILDELLNEGKLCVHTVYSLSEEDYDEQS